MRAIFIPETERLFPVEVFVMIVLTFNIVEYPQKGFIFLLLVCAGSKMEEKKKITFLQFLGCMLICIILYPILDYIEDSLINWYTASDSFSFLLSISIYIQSVPSFFF
jgi:uncharacterized membrane protein